MFGLRSNWGFSKHLESRKTKLFHDMFSHILQAFSEGCLLEMCDMSQVNAKLSDTHGDSSSAMRNKQGVRRGLMHWSTIQVSET